jgi:hypothetical protein
MKMFVFEYVDELTNSYHSGGGLAVVAEDMEHVDSLLVEASSEHWSSDANVRMTDDERSRAIVYELAGLEEPRVFVFPNTGCC